MLLFKVYHVLNVFLATFREILLPSGLMMGEVSLGPMMGEVSLGPMMGEVSLGPMMGEVSLGPMMGESISRNVAKKQYHLTHDKLRRPDDGRSISRSDDGRKYFSKCRQKNNIIQHMINSESSINFKVDREDHFWRPGFLHITICVFLPGGGGE